MKTRLLVVLLVSSLILALSVPTALAQDATAVDGKAAKGSDVQYVDCSQVASALQNQYDGAVADDEATAEVANEQDITIEQVNACLGEIGQLDDGNGDGDGDRDADEGGTDTDSGTGAGTKADVIDSTVPKVDELPETGGPSLFVVLAGAALVAGGASLIGFSIRR